jgi:hypothetical protein
VEWRNYLAAGAEECASAAGAEEAAAAAAGAVAFASAAGAAAGALDSTEETDELASTLGASSFLPQPVKPTTKPRAIAEVSNTFFINILF